MATVCTRSGPRASTASTVTIDESMPPDRPITTSEKPFFSTYDRVPTTSASHTSSSGCRCGATGWTGPSGWDGGSPATTVVGVTSTSGSCSSTGRPRGSSRRLRYTGPTSTSTTSTSSTNCGDRARSDAVGREGHRPAVEDQLVLPADLVDVDQRGAGIGGPGGEHALPPGQLPLGEGRRVDVDDHLGAAVGLVGDGARRVPRVLADRHPDRHAPAPSTGPRARRPGRSSAARRTPRSWAARTSGRCPSTSPPAQMAAALCRSRAWSTKPDDRDAVGGRGGDPVERLDVGGDEARLQEEVLRRVAGDRQLREGGDVGPGLAGGAVRGEDPLDVAVEVADARVDLAGGDAEAGHGLTVPAHRSPVPGRPRTVPLAPWSTSGRASSSSSS